jgi:hypothetical protein
MAASLARSCFASEAVSFQTPTTFVASLPGEGAVGPVPGGHRSGLRLMPGNKALQPVATEHWLSPRAGYQVHFLLPNGVSGCYPVEESFSGMPEAFR